jgi:putative exosortase-associated protein (TIGR04073 family)
MMKKLFFAAIVLSLIASFATPVFCEEVSTKLNGPVTKLGRGVCNMMTFPLEIPEQISRVNNTDGPFAASTVGVLKGLGWAVGRACVGVFEAATFMLPGNKNYEPVLKDPEYFLDNSNF